MYNQPALWLVSTFLCSAYMYNKPASWLVSTCSLFYVHVPSETHAQIEHLLPVQLNTFSEFVGKILYLLNFLVIFAFNQQASNTFSEFVGKILYLLNFLVILLLMSRLPTHSVSLLLKFVKTTLKLNKYKILPTETVNVYTGSPTHRKFENILPACRNRIRYCSKMHDSCPGMPG